MSKLTEEVSAEDGWKRWCSLMAEAYARFQERLSSLRSQHPGLTGYAIADRVGVANGTFAWRWGASSDVMETINSINAWGGRLHSWNAWNLVVTSYEARNDKWDLLNHFVEPVAFFCMLQPSSFADRITVAAETLLHQANQRLFPDQPDRLKQDELPPGRTLRRSDRRKQLNSLGLSWSTYPRFRDALAMMDSDDYQRGTQNFRDLTNHSFAPRFMLGEVSRALRSIVPWQERVEQVDGSFQFVDDPTRKSVQYAMSSVPPLKLEDAHAANLDEYFKARRTMDEFANLVNELCDRMDELPT